MADQQREREVAGFVERLDPAFDRLVPADAVIERVAGGFAFIEGPVWIPGPPGHLLFSDIPGNTVYQWSAGEGAVFFDANTLRETGLPDGLTLDQNGNVYASGPGGVLVISPEGKHLGTIAPNERPANAGWGDDGSTLYMTAHSSLYRIRLNASGR